MDDTEKYLGQLASALRWRRVEEERVREALLRVRAAVADGPGTAVEQLGEPRDLARSFPTGKGLSVGLVVGVVGSVVVLAASIGLVVGRDAFDADGIPPLVSFVTLPLALVALYLGQLVDRRLPADLTRTAEAGNRPDAT